MQAKLLYGAGSPGEYLSPDVIDMPIRNVHGATITVGLPANYTNTAASLDGAQATLPVSTALRLFAGIALKTIPNNGLGLVRAYGLVNSVAIFAHGASVTIAADVTMGVGVAGSLGVSSTGFVGVGGGYVISCEAAGALVCSAGGYIKGFVRAL